MKRLMLGALATAALAVTPLRVEAQARPSDSLVSNGAPPLTATDLAVFLDGVVPLALKTYDVAGVVVAVVKDGKLLLAKGYGFADLAHRHSVVPESTLFRVASISKLFTATAVMQLVEQGKLGLDEDIGRYLDFKLPKRFPDKITLRHLLTHTAGFQESVKQLPADSGQGVALRDYVKEMTPDQIYRPGTVTAYSNYGNDLAGYVVEHVSGMPYAEYVRTRTLEPLGMRHSSVAQPLPAELRAQVSLEYPTASDPAGEFQILQGEPSGNMSSTATDMARFAIAHLQLGVLDGQRILQDSTARQMGTTQFRTHPEVPGMGLGFFEEHRNGYRIQGHGGDLARFHSLFSLLMDEGVGFFISANSSGRGGALSGLREAVQNAFLDRYFPRRIPLEPVMPNAVAQARRFAGSYTLSRRGETSLARIAMLLANLDLTANEDGTLENPLLAGPNGQPLRWFPIDSTTYRTADGSQRIGFVAAGNGLPARAGFLGGIELHRVGLADSRSFNLMLLGGSLAVFLATLVLWPVSGLIRRRYGAPPPDDGVGTGLRTMTRVAALLSVAFLTGIGIFAALGLNGTLTLDRRFDPLLGAIRFVGLLGALGTVAFLAALVRSVKTGQNSWARLKYLALVIAGVSFGWFAVHWHLLSWSFRY